MPKVGDETRPEKEKDETPKTRPMPPKGSKEFTEWEEKFPKAKPEDKGKLPPDAPQDLKEPRKPGTTEQQ